MTFFADLALYFIYHDQWLRMPPSQKNGPLIVALIVASVLLIQAAPPLSMTNIADHDSIAHESQLSPDIASDKSIAPVKR